MSIEVNVWLFNVKQCGYYSNIRDNGTPPAFGALKDSLNALKKWSIGKKVSETCTFDVPQDSDLQKTFLLAAEPHANGDWLLGLWNQVHSASNKIASIGLDEVIGATQTKFTDVDKDRVPGIATYFYFMPADSRVAAIRVKHSTNGLRNFEEYMRGFLGTSNPSHVTIENIAGEDVHRYRETTQSAPSSVFPRFATGPIRKPGDVDFILANRDRIRKVVCKTTLTATHRVERAWWGRALDIFQLGTGGHALVDEVPVKLDLPFTFSEEELSAVLVEWQTRLAETTSSWDDLGFVMRGDQNVRWLSKSYARKAIDVDVQWIDEEQVDAAHLLNQLVFKRHEILAAG